MHTPPKFPAASLKWSSMATTDRIEEALAAAELQELPIIIIIYSYCI
jgi:hypothetical protein